MYDTSLWLGGKEFKSRLIVGTGKYPSFENMREAIEASGSEIVTVAVRRVSLPGQGESLLDYVDPKRYTLLPNTAGCSRKPDRSLAISSAFFFPMARRSRSARPRE